MNKEFLQTKVFTGQAQESFTRFLSSYRRQSPSTVLPDPKTPVMSSPAFESVGMCLNITDYMFKRNSKAGLQKFSQIKHPIISNN